MDLAQLDHLFTSALAVTAPADRAAFLDQACSADPELRERIDALLAAHAAAGSFLELPDEEATTPFVALSERPGTTIGRYKLLEQIGEGGFGVVFMAEQESPVRRRVALKVIKLGMDTKQVVARFEAERQALAMMDHPNIAKVFDAGATDTGRPYFVMELVRGVPITEYCDQARLTTKDRLALFQSVCSAVQHAHQKGIIHRDLKPSNILVTLHDDKAVPKVIDFGVAKATQARLTERTLFTEFRQMIGTPSYMSPEQAQMSGLDVDTRSDVYSLGVLLYELLTGSTPIDTKQLRGTTYDDLRRLICEVDPPRPSARLSTLSKEALTTLATARHCDTTHLAVNFRSDLDWIVMRCLEKDRRRRYESASALELDIQRYLEGQPVDARPPTLRYRVSKYVRRNRGAVIAAAAAITALVAGLGMASVGMVQARQQARIAQIESDRSNQVARFLSDMLSAVRPGVARGRDTALLREIIDTTAERVESDLQDQPEVQGDLWATLASTYKALDDRERGALLYEKAVASYRLAPEENSGKLAIALGELGDLQNWLGQTDEGRKNAELGLAIARRLNDPDTLVKCLQNVARAQGEKGGYCSGTEAEIPYLEEALKISQTHDSDAITRAEVMSYLGLCLDDSKHADRPLQLAQEALKLSRQSLSDDDVRIARCLYYLGQIHANRGEHDQAVEQLSAAIEIDRTIYPSGHSTILSPLQQLAYNLEAIGRTDEAVDILNEVAKRTQAAFGENDRRSIQSQLDIVVAHHRFGRYQENDAQSQTFLTKCRDLYGPHHGMTIEALVYRGYALAGINRREEAAEVLGQAYDASLQTDGYPLRGQGHIAIDYGYNLKLLGRQQEAIAAYSEPIRRLKKASSHDSALYLLLRAKADAHSQFGEFEAARECLRDAVSACAIDDWQNRNQVAWILATSTFEEIRNGKLAVEIATKAAELTDFKDAGTLDTLAAAYAETKDFAAAVSWEEKAVKLAPDQARFKFRLNAYRQHRQIDLGDPWLLSTSSDPKLRDGKRALAIAKDRAETYNYADAKSLAILATAYAENLDFDTAVRWQEKAVQLANREQKERYERYLESFRNKQRWWVEQ